MSIVNGEVTNGSPIGGEMFTFFGVGPRSDGRYYWADVLLSGSINPKSKNKPMEYLSDTNETISGKIYGRRTQLSGNQKYSVNYGNNIVEYTNGLTAIHGVAAGTNVTYTPPSSWGRIADFWGYNHYAGNWHNVSTKITSIGQGSSADVSVTNIEDIFNFGALSGLNTGNVNFGFLMWNAAFSATQAQVYFLSLTNMATAGQTLTDLKDSLTFSTASLSQGTWRMYPCITTVSFTRNSFTTIKTEDATGKWFPLPYSNTHIITVVASGSGEENVIDSITVEDGGYTLEMVDSSNLVFRLTDLNIDITNDSDASYTITIQWQISNYVSGSGVNTPTQTASATVAAGETVTVALYSAKTEDEAYRFQVGDTPPVLRVDYSLAKDGQTQESYVEIEMDKY